MSDLIELAIGLAAEIQNLRNHYKDLYDAATQIEIQSDAYRAQYRANLFVPCDAHDDCDTITEPRLQLSRCDHVVCMKYVRAQLAANRVPDGELRVVCPLCADDPQTLSINTSLLVYDPPAVVLPDQVSEFVQLNDRAWIALESPAITRNPRASILAAVVRRQ